MTTQNISQNPAIVSAQGTFIDSIIDWFDGLSPVSDNLDISITLNAEELRADLDYGRNG